MSLLGLTVTELQQRIEAELAANPALELVEDRRCPICRRPLAGSQPCPICSRAEGSSPEQPIVFLSPRDDLRARGASADDLPDDPQTPEIEDLPHFVLSQIAAELAATDRPIAAHLLTSLDDDGLLTISPAEIARYHHIPLARVESILRLIQHAEPVGVGSSSPQEALLVQLDVLSETRSVPEPAWRAIREGMDLLSRRQYGELGQRLGLTEREAQKLAAFISENLNPFPARAHWGEAHLGSQSSKEVYHTPDAIISRLHPDDQAPLVVEVITPFAGTLQLNPLFRQALSQAPADKAGQWRAHLESAALLVKCVQQRNQAIVRLMQRLSILQRAFILHGEAHLQPITRARLARDLGVHESTISRAVADKCVQLPSGRIVPLAMFFDRSLQVRTALKKIIAQEGRVLSDSELVQRLAAIGYQVARRTVAKYRAMEGILPAHLRKHSDLA
jgi:RNA polymerase sigma-54 factor